MREGEIRKKRAKQRERDADTEICIQSTAFINKKQLNSENIKDFCFSFEPFLKSASTSEAHYMVLGVKLTR